MKNEDLLSTVSSFLKKHDFKKVTVALSGGCDSVALLSSVHAVLGDGNVFAVHVNHGIRGEEADRDEQFCISLCESLNIPIEIYRFNIPELAKKESVGLEECARKYRYHALRQSCEKFGTYIIATAHNANDNAESVIFNLCRGTGLGGTSGIPRIRSEQGMTVIRPILPVLRSEIVKFVESNGLSHVTDSTNADTAYTRNYIRAKIIPELCVVNEKAILNIFSCAEIISYANDFINKCADDVLTPCLCGDSCYIPKERFESLDPAVKSTVICNAYNRITGQVISRELVDISLEFIHSSETGSAIDLPLGIELYNCGKDISISPKRCSDDYTVNLNEGMNDLTPFGFKITVLNDPDENFVREYKNIYNFVKWSILNTDMIKGTLTAKKRVDGDRYTVDGMSRKIKNLLADKKIPHDRRSRYPLICDDNGIICTPGCPVKDGYDGRISEHKTYIIYTNSKRSE